MNSIVQCRELIAAIGPELTTNQVMSIMEQVENFCRIADEAKQSMRRMVLEYIDETGCGDIVYGDKRYYPGTTTTYKAKNHSNVLNALLQISDIDTIAACLGSTAWKGGALKKVLPTEAFDDLIEKKVQPDLKTGKPKRSLKSQPIGGLPA